MKLLYLNPFDFTGYGQAGIGNVLSMLSVGLDVVCRQINLGKPVSNKIIKGLLKKEAYDCDVVITHCLPTFFDYSGHFKRNIGMFAYETNVIPKDWIRRIKCMDEVWVINNHMKKVVKSHMLNMPIKIIPHAIDTDKFKSTFDTTIRGPAAKLKQETGAHIFYSINEFVSRKNFESLLTAYLSTFSPSDNTILFIKTWKNGMSSAECHAKFTGLINFIKGDLKLIRYPRIELCCDFWPDVDIERLHYEADTYVECSHGEAWGLSAFESIGYGKTPIVPECTGYLDYIQMNNGFLIKGQNQPCKGALDTLEELHTGLDTWFEPNLEHLKELMRKVYLNTGGCVSNRKKHSLKTLEKFSYESIGKTIKKALEI